MASRDFTGYRRMAFVRYDKFGIPFIEHIS